MPRKGIVTGQRLSPQLHARAKELRQKLTPTEWLLWQHLRAGRNLGYHFRRQQRIDRFLVDFYCHKAALVVEVDGGIHLEQHAYDRERELFLRDIGLRVLRSANTEVEHNPEEVLHAILKAHQEGDKSGNEILSQRNAVCWTLSSMGRSQQHHPASLKGIPFPFKFKRSIGSRCSEPLGKCEDMLPQPKATSLSPRSQTIMLPPDMECDHC